MTIKQLFKVDEAMIYAIKMTAAIAMIVAAFVTIGLFVIGGFFGVLLIIVCTVLTMIGSINYIEHNR